MAVDANIVIFERIRKNCAQGRTLRVAMDAENKNAFSVLPPNVTTCIAAMLPVVAGVPVPSSGLQNIANRRAPVHALR